MICLFEFPELHEICPYNTCIRERCPTIKKFLEICKERRVVCYGTGEQGQEIDSPYCSFGFCIGSDLCPRHVSNNREPQEAYEMWKKTGDTKYLNLGKI